jgi:predicted RNA-binding Zn-ribbon protein involved in translation (DUF1610 family)
MISKPSQAQATYQCPKCGSPQVSRSQRVGGLDRLKSVFNIYPYRCRKHSCGNRFYEFGKS